MDSIQITITKENIPAVQAYLSSLPEGSEKSELQRKVTICELRAEISSRKEEIAQYEAELEELENGS